MSEPSVSMTRLQELAFADSGIADHEHVDLAPQRHGRAVAAGLAALDRHTSDSADRADRGQFFVALQAVPPVAFAMT